MGWFSKKKEGEVPDLPELPEVPTVPDSPGSTTSSSPKTEDSFPELPDVEINDLPELPEERPMEEVSLPPKTVEKPVNLGPPVINRPAIEPKKVESPVEMQPSPPPLGRAESEGYIQSAYKKAEPVYIRLDRFQTTVETFEEIKDKIIDIEKLLSKTKEIRAKEQAELDDWEREIHLIKTRVEAIDKSILHKLD